MTDGSPHAVIEPVSRWRFLVYVRDGISRHGPYGHGWEVLGRRRAERKARRVLADYLARAARLADREKNATIIWPEAR